MDWSSMFEADVVVFGCGNILFGDDGLAPRAVAALAAEAAAAIAGAAAEGNMEAVGAESGEAASARGGGAAAACAGSAAMSGDAKDAASVTAAMTVTHEASCAPGASGATLAADASGRRVAYIDAGTSIRTLLLDLTLMEARPRRVIVLDVVKEPGRTPGSIRRENLDAQHDGDMAGGFLHHAPTWGLLRRLRDALGADVVVLTVQAAYIPEQMDDTLSPEAQEALPRLMDMVRWMCGPQDTACCC